MKRKLLISVAAAFGIVAVISILTLHAAETTGGPVYEYATIRWAGRDNTHVIRPNGEVEFLGVQLKGVRRPERADDRSFHMNIMLNGMARDGWELTAMTSDDMVVRRVRR